MDWSSYAHVYDIMASNNPSYQDIVKQAINAFADIPIPDGGIIADLGAGTGNFSIAIAGLKPNAIIHHVDNNPQMIALAREKAAQQKISNIQFINSDTTEYLNNAGKLHAVISVHAIYPLSHPREAISGIYEKLAPNGHLVVCDLGRILDIKDWAFYFFRKNVAQNGFLYTLKMFYRGRTVSAHNKVIANNQKSGIYWTHTTEEFKQTLQQAGFHVSRIMPMYRDYSDFAVAKKPGSKRSSGAV